MEQTWELAMKPELMLEQERALMLEQERALVQEQGRVWVLMVEPELELVVELEQTWHSVLPLRLQEPIGACLASIPMCFGQSLKPSVLLPQQGHSAHSEHPNNNTFP